ncbi:MAG: ABC transporter permease [Candidatus Methanoplasma sp.]|jgi:putative ABC transport system permease protein|nr:ABC transporter permease [Candidatus Methanoplasma sp.]
MNLRQLSIRNLNGKPFRTAGLIIIVATLAFTLSFGSVLVQSLENGASNVEERIGADLLVVPIGSESKAEAVLLKGEPSTFYMDKAVLDKVLTVKGVAQASPQFYLMSISDDPCCDYPVQMIAFDPKTDFTIAPWIAQTYGGEISTGDIIVGSEIIIRDDGKVRFFGNDYPVVAQLGRSGTGMDASVFMTLETMPQLIAGAVSSGSIAGDAADKLDSISTVLVRVEEGVDVASVALDISISATEMIMVDGSPKLVGVDVVQSTNVVAGLTSQMSALVGYVSVFLIAIWVLSIIVLAVIFSVTIGERKKEFATFRMLGATRKKLASVVLYESALIGLIGGVAGVAVSAAVIIPFSTNIGKALELPYVMPSSLELISIFVLALVLSFAIGVLTSLWSAVKISKADTYVTMREGE